MSRLYFHSPSATAELRGSERAWLSHIAQGVAAAAWDLDSHDAVVQAGRIIAMIPEPDPGLYQSSYLHVGIREALGRKDRYYAECERLRGEGRDSTAACAILDHDADRQLVRSLATYLNVSGGGTFEVAGHELGILNVTLNTAIAAGSPPVQLAAKLDGACEQHCWVDGPDRAWLADVIKRGLNHGILRHGFWWVDRPCHGDPTNQPDRQWSDLGWGDVLGLLWARNDEPVVCSYSVCDQFPNHGAAEAGGWRPTLLPDGWVPDWAVTDGRSEWDAMSADDQDEYRRDAIRSQWYELPAVEQWATAMTGLRAKPWLQITPESLGGQMFGAPVTAYDLLAPDRDERIREAFANSDAS